MANNRLDKTCTKCGVFKPISEYDVCRIGKSGLPTYYARCKPCRLEEAREAVRERYLSRFYGITVEQYDDLSAKQLGLCAICGREETAPRIKTSRPLSVDHDHATGRVRGLLCSSCNRALGLFGDNIEILKKALDYLQSGADYHE